MHDMRNETLLNLVLQVVNAMLLQLMKMLFLQVMDMMLLQWLSFSCMNSVNKPKRYAKYQDLIYLHIIYFFLVSVSSCTVTICV